MTDEQIRASVINTLNALDVCRDRLPSPGDISLVESLCREMVAEGLERGADKADRYPCNPEARRGMASFADWARHEAARLKENA